MFESLLLSLAIATTPAAVTTAYGDGFAGPLPPSERVDNYLCRSDIDHDGVVGFLDMLIVLNDWGQIDTIGPMRADIYGNRMIGMGDLLCVFCDWGPCP